RYSFNLLYFFYCYISHSSLHSFPTRRSSDLIETFQVSPSPGKFRRGGCSTEARRIDKLRDDSHGSSSMRDGRFAQWPLRYRRQRSEEHTSELQSLAYLVCRLLLEKKNYTKAH